MSVEPRISVVVVTWNSGSIAGQCLDALAAHPPAVPWELIVIDNGSTDDTVARVRSHELEVALIANRANRGLAAANNQGIARSRAPFVLLSNPDSIVGEGAIDALLELCERRSRAAFAVPRLRYPDGSPQASAGGLPSLRDALLGRQAQRWVGGGQGGLWWEGWTHDEERRIGRGHEACYLVRRSAIAEIGLQDERFALDWEGIEWAARAAAGGWEIWFTPAAEVTHVGGVSIRQAPFRWVVGSHLGMYRYFAARSSLLLRPLLAAVVALRGVAKAGAALAGAASYQRSHRA